MQRTALISDIHGNAIALRAVLDDIHRRGVDQLVCLGDVATLGPEPVRCLELLAHEVDAFILGNHDDYLLDATIRDAHNSAPIIADAIAWARNQLDDACRALLRTFAQRRTLDLGHHQQLLAFHGSPDSYIRDVLAETPASDLDTMLTPHPADVFAGGHTHIQMLRQHRGRWLLNPGSVGLPFRTHPAGAPPDILPHAEYALIETTPASLRCTLHRLPLDPATLEAAAKAWHHPFARLLADQYAS